MAKNAKEYYKKILLCFSQYLMLQENGTMEKTFAEDATAEALKEFILSKKKLMEERLFYYRAGSITQGVLTETVKEGAEAFDACCVAVLTFELFIGIMDVDKIYEE